MAQKQTAGKHEDEEELPVPRESARNETLAEDVDDLLDEIDAVLEENAEAFVRGFIQKGGQ